MRYDKKEEFTMTWRIDTPVKEVPDVENISLVIVTDDRDYGRALGRAIQHLCEGVIIRLAGKDEFFAKAREAGEGRLVSGDLILWDGAEAEKVFGERIVLLSDKRSMATKDFGNRRFCLYKYDSARSTVASLLEIYGYLTGRKNVNMKRRTAKIIAFASWAGGTGCTVISLAVAQELSRFAGKRVMYVSLEETESTGEFMRGGEGMRGTGVYLYHLMGRDMTASCGGAAGESGPPDLQGYVLRDDFGVEAFAPTEGRNPLRDLPAEEMETFIASVADSGRYDVIVVDIGCGLSAADISCLGMAERICLIAKSTENGARRRQYMRHLMCSCGSGISERLIEVENMAGRGYPDGKASDGDREAESGVVRISYSDTFLQRGEVKRIFPDGSFGRDIKELTARITEI